MSQILSTELFKDVANTSKIFYLPPHILGKCFSTSSFAFTTPTLPHSTFRPSFLSSVHFSLHKQLFVPEKPKPSFVDPHLPAPQIPIMFLC